MTPELKEQAIRLAADPALAAVVDDLKGESTRKMLAAKTSEERDDHWREYHAIDGLLKRLKLMASNAKAKAK